MGLFTTKKNKEDISLRQQQRAFEAAAKKAKKAEAKKAKESEKNSQKHSNKNRPYYCKIEWPLSGGPGQCFGCKYEIEKVFRQHRDGVPVAQQHAIVFHDTFQQLHDCASNCLTCRVFERSLLKAQSTLEDEEHLEARNSGTDTVTARLVPNSDAGSKDLILEITIQGVFGQTWLAHVACTRAKGLEYLKTVHIDHNNSSIHEQAQSWLDACTSDHDQCRRLFWSGNNPTRLIKILNETQIQLVDMSDKTPTVPYVALSYCWGSDLPPGEWEFVKKGMTWSSTIERRLRPFDMTEFPKTLHDTVEFVRRMDIEYVWIDAVCIIQDELPNQDKEREMGRMHEYYGNALFTLCLSSTTKSTEGFLRPRKAWRFKEGGCELAGYDLLNIDIALETASEQSPWAKRAWTLQEEHLSPRRLYWFNQSLYWSCAESKHIEGVKDPSRRPKPVQTPLTLVTSTEENFLVACRKAYADIAKSEWLRIVESYARRDMGHTTDRFPAISGVASRYWQAQFGRDQYIAGLWRNHFAELLAWQVITPAMRIDCDEPLQAIPSWSWASLPIKTGILAHPTRFARPFQPGEEDLELLSHPMSTEKSNQEPEEAIDEGGQIKSVQVRGRLRPFWLDKSIPKSWHEAFTVNKQGREILHPEYSGITLIHSIHPSDGRVMVAGDRMDEVYGHLDYIEDVHRAVNGKLRIYALQLSSSSLLLLEQCEEATYRRVGVCHEFWSSFLVGFDAVDIALI